MRSVYAIWRMMARRSIANWRLAATLVLGVLVAATLLAAAPIYARAMADLGLTFAIRDRLEESTQTQVVVRDVPLAAADGRRVQEAIAGRADERIGWFTGAREWIAQGPRFFVAPEGQLPSTRFFDPEGRLLPNPAPLIVVGSFSSAADHVRVVQGRLPEPRTGPSGSATVGVLELALSPKAAETGGLKVGDRVNLAEFFDDCAREIPREDRPPPPPCTPRTRVQYTFPGEVVGIVEPISVADPFWVSGAAALFDPFRLDVPEFGPLLPAFVHPELLRTGFGGAMPEYRATFTWNYFADPEKLTRANFERARADIVALREDIQPVGGFAFSPMEGVLADFGTELNYQQTPLLLLLLQITGIALFYVGVIAAMVVERQADEIALLRSRGAGRVQVAGIYLLEGLTIAVPVTLVAPLLAGWITALLGLTPTFHRVTGGDPLPAHIGPEAFLLAALGAVLSLAMLVGPAFLAARMTGVTSRRQAARPGASFFRRYYLDLAVVALAALLLWELRERGSVFTPSSTGGLSTDPLLLLSPALLTLGAGALLLRFYPLLLRMASALVSAVAGVPVVLGLWQVVRNPGQYTRLALLLMMAVAVGTFAASYSTTAEKSFRDRASFQAGVDMRATPSTSSYWSVQEITDGLEKIEGVDRASPVLRTAVSLATPGGGLQEINLLAVDPDAVAGGGGRQPLLWFREDLADESLPELMAHLRGPIPRGKPLPPGTTTISVWVKPPEGRENVTMWVRVRDSAGQVSMLELGKLEFTDWRQLRTPLAGPYQPELTPPLALVSILWSEPANVTVARATPVYIDDITAEGAGGATVIEDFEGPVAWEAAPSRAATRGPAVQDEFKTSNEQVRSGSSAGRFLFRTGVSTGLRGLYVKDPSVPLPVIASPEFIALTGAGVGQTALVVSTDTLVPVIVRGVARLFPTIPAGTPFILANRDQVSAWAGVFSDGALRRPNEVWVSLEPGADRRRTERDLATGEFRLGNIVDRERVLQSVNANPLVAAGGSGILVTAFIAVFLLVTVALLVTLVTSVQRRRTEFAVMRAMGVSRGQVFRLLAFEYALVAVLGLAAGAYLGLMVGRRMLGFLNVTETGSRVAPPFILQTNWLMVTAALATVVLTFLVGMFLSTQLLERQATGQTLRQTE